MRIQVLYPLVITFILNILLTGSEASGPNRSNHKNNNVILLGQSCPLSGSAQTIGRSIRAGILAQFGKVNAEGGVSGRKLRLLSRDDENKPYKAIKRSQGLVSRDRVFLLIGHLTHSTLRAAAPVSLQKRIPIFGSYSGPEMMANSHKGPFVTIRPNISFELKKLLSYLIGNQKLTRLACFYPNEEFGRTVEKTLKQILKGYQLKLNASVSYEPYSDAVSSGLLAIHHERPQAVLLVGAVNSISKMVRLSKTIGMQNTIFSTISGVDSVGLQDRLGMSGDGMIMVQTMPFPWNTDIPLIAEYNEFLKKYQPKQPVNFLSLEGYVIGKLFSMAAHETGRALSRKTLMEVIKDKNGFDMGGFTVGFDENGVGSIGEPYISVIRGNRIVRLDSIE